MVNVFLRSYMLVLAFFIIDNVEVFESPTFSVVRKIIVGPLAGALFITLIHTAWYWPNV